MKKFFSYSQENGFLFHYTESEAREAAENQLELQRETALQDGWYDEVADICYGRITRNAINMEVFHILKTKNWK